MGCFFFMHFRAIRYFKAEKWFWTVWPGQCGLDSVEVWKCRSGSVVVWCGVEVWPEPCGLDSVAWTVWPGQCGSVEVWKCGSVEVWKCGSVVWCGKCCSEVWRDERQSHVKLLRREVFSAFRRWFVTRCRIRWRRGGSERILSLPTRCPRNWRSASKECFCPGPRPIRWSKTHKNRLFIKKLLWTIIFYHLIDYESCIFSNFNGLCLSIENCEEFEDLHGMPGH